MATPRGQALQPEPGTARRFKIPESVLVVIHTAALDVLLIERADMPGYWQSVTGSKDSRDEALVATAVREVAEETGISSTVLRPLGTIDYWFVAEGRRVHKTVHHFLLRAEGGELSDADIEVVEVAWVPLTELPTVLEYDDERSLVARAPQLLEESA